MNTNTTMTEITTTLPIPNGYKFVRIDNVINTKESYINFNMTVTNNTGDRWVSDYLWVIVKKVKPCVA